MQWTINILLDDLLLQVFYNHINIDIAAYLVHQPSASDNTQGDNDK